MEKMCMTCSLLKPIRKEDEKRNFYNPNQIHEYNYSCYECLDKLKQKETDLLYQQLKSIGILYSS